MINRWPKNPCCEETEGGIAIPRQDILMPSRKRVDGWRGWWPCIDCCGEECDCECEHSSDGTVKCCMNVTIAGMAGSGGSCSEADCLDYNTTHSLYRSTSDDSGNCVWKCTALDLLVQGCETDTITATLYLDGSDYKLKVELGSHVWERNFSTTKPDLCDGGPWTLTHQTNSGNCDSSSATCTVTMAVGKAPCDCDPCDNCPEDFVLADEYEVIIAGIYNRNAGPCATAGLCADLNDTYILTFQGPYGSYCSPCPPIVVSPYCTHCQRVYHRDAGPCSTSNTHQHITRIRASCQGTLGNKSFQILIENDSYPSFSCNFLTGIFFTLDWDSFLGEWEDGTTTPTQEFDGKNIPFSYSVNAACRGDDTTPFGGSPEATCTVTAL